MLEIYQIDWVMINYSKVTNYAFQKILEGNKVLENLMEMAWEFILVEMRLCQSWLIIATGKKCTKMY